MVESRSRVKDIIAQMLVTWQLLLPITLFSISSYVVLPRRLIALSSVSIMRLTWDCHIPYSYIKRTNSHIIYVTIQLFILIHVPCIFYYFFTITNKSTINTITVYITTVSLCNIYCYMFRHFHVTIRQFTANVLLSYTRSANCSCW